MKVEEQQIGTVDVFAPAGALADEEAESFLKRLLVRAKSGSPRMVLSMEEVSYIDSAAVEGLLEAADALGDRAMSLKLAHVPPTCREVMELTGVAARFSFFQSVQDAVRSFL